MKIKLSMLLILLTALVISACGDQKIKTSITPTETTELEQANIDSISYMFGNQIGGFLGTYSGNFNFENFIKGIEEAYNEVPDSLMMIPVSSDAPQRIFTAFNEMLTAKLQSENLEEADAFLVENGKKEGVEITASGLQYEVMTEGTGEVPTPTSKVKVNYHGTFIDGSVFDSSIDRGEPVEFPLNGVIPGWTEGVQLMKVGAKYRFAIPPVLGYGEQGQPNRGGGYAIEPNTLLIFEIELLEIMPPEEAPEGIMPQ